MRTPTAVRLSAADVAVNDGDTLRLRATVVDQNGQPFAALPAGTTLAWSSGSTAVASVADGLVTGVHRGETRVYVQAGAMKDSARVSVRAVARTLQYVKGSAQTGAAGALLADTLVVRALDRNGEAVEGVAVELVVTAGGGSVAPAAATTDAQGYAKARWTLGAQAGANTLEARVAGLAGSPVRFTATGGAGAASRVEKAGGDAQSGPVGAPLATPLTARVTDAAGNPVAGVTVTWRVTGGGGSLSPTVGTSDASGLARATWTLGNVAGSNAATASAAGASASFSATATAAPAPLREFVAVQPGTETTCALTRDGAAYCWGDNSVGQLGNNAGAVPSNVPVAVVGGARYAVVSTGGDHSCAVTPDGAAHCWGSNTWGQVGAGRFGGSGYPAPALVLTGLVWKQISAGAEGHTCALSVQAAAFCWGYNWAGQVGDGTTTSRAGPAAVTGGLRFDSISSGHTHTCAVTTDRAAYCWGRGDAGQLGVATTSTCELGDNRWGCSLAPVRVPGGHRFFAVAAGGFFSCGHREGDGAAWCWGRGDEGQLGTGSTASTSTPQPVSGGLSFAAVTAGSYHACGTTADGTAYCWGDNRYGQLGDGTQNGSTVPVRVAGGIRFKQVAAGGYNTCGIGVDRITYCWGLNGRGEVGDGSRATYRTVPSRVAGQ